MAEKEKYRITIGTFDLIKGFAIIVVVFAHMTYYYDATKLLPIFPAYLILKLIGYSINPLFFMIIGYNFKQEPLRKLLKKTYRELIIPYVVVMLICMVLFPVMHYLTYNWWPGAIHETIRYFIAFLLGIPRGGRIIWGYSVYECSVMWFFLAIFIARNVLNVILKIKKEILQGSAVLMCMAFGLMLYKIGFIYYCLPQGLMAVGYSYIGLMCKKYRVIEKLEKAKWIYVVLAVLTVFHAFWSRFDMAYGEFEHGVVDFVLAACSGFLLFSLGARVGNADRTYLEPLRKIGVYTYWILCIHCVETTCIPWYHWSEIMSRRQLTSFLVEVCVKILLMTLGCCALKEINKYKYRKKLRGKG